MKKSRWSRALIGSAVLSLFATTLMAALVSANTTQPIPGVDSNGSPTPDTTGNGNGKLYKETVTGILVTVVGGVVPNKSGAPATFVNQGVTIKDTFADEEVTATQDQENVSAPKFKYSAASLIAIYFPPDSQD